MQDHIYQYLEQTPEEPKSLNNIYDYLWTHKLIDETPETKVRFQATVRSMPEDVFLFWKNDQMYLVYTEELEMAPFRYGMMEMDKDVEIGDIDVDEMTVLEHILDHVDSYPDFDPDAQFAKTDCPIHMCCQVEDSTFLRKLDDSYYLDLDVFNDNNETALDIVRANKDVEKIEILYGIRCHYLRLEKWEQKEELEHEHEMSETRLHLFYSVMASTVSMTLLIASMV